jgi:4-hydroxyphenylpyruvate dioxygenase
VTPRYPRSIATVCLSGGLADKLDTAARIGFDGVEIFENDLLTFDGSPGEIRRIAEDLGLTITIFQPFRDFEAMPEVQRLRNLDRAERKFDLMQQLGTDLVLVCSNVQPGAIDDDARAAADLRAMAERAAARGLRVGYEALAWGRHVNRWAHAWRIVQQADHPALGLIVDSFHTLAVGDDPAGIADVPGEKIFFVQLADAPLLKMDVLSLSRHFRNFPGQGELDVPGFLRPVLASGYAGPLSLEIFNDDFRAAPAQMIARDGLRSLALMEAEVGLVTVPPPSRIDGVEFLEFAVDDATAPLLADRLGTLGFRHAGRHRSKSVDLYRQGGINLVLNREQDSAASEHFQLHGVSVCALALRVDDVAATIMRAEALYCPEWRGGEVREGERIIPAVRVPDGLLLHLIQYDPTGRTIWEDDFDLIPVSISRDSAHLTSIDHIAEALPANALDGAVLFWRAVFGMESTAPIDLTDPYGLVSSRAMISPGGGFRLPLNTSDSRDTTTGRFVSRSSGAGIQHIAFATADVMASVAALGEKAAILAIPNNYYDDLGARWPLSEEALEGMRRLNVLYDVDAGGEFLHAFTDLFDGRLFFELVERRGSTGFGAANAAFRLAAQSAARASPVM